jgi:hypothetical protein
VEKVNPIKCLYETTFSGPVKVHALYRYKETIGSSEITRIHCCSIDERNKTYPRGFEFDARFIDLWNSVKPVGVAAMKYQGRPEVHKLPLVYKEKERADLCPDCRDFIRLGEHGDPDLPEPIQVLIESGADQFYSVEEVSEWYSDEFSIHACECCGRKEAGPRYSATVRRYVKEDK